MGSSLDDYEKKFLEDFRERIIKHFIDVIVIAELTKGKPMSGFDVIWFIHRKYDIMLSSGTVYSRLYTLERKGILKGTMTSRKVIYSISEKGQKLVPIIMKLNLKIQECLKNLDIS